MAAFKVRREQTAYEEFTVLAATPEDAEEFADTLEFVGSDESYVTEIDLISEDNYSTADYDSEVD
jgi:ATP-dependent RNA circularization protein (DNA/RNA ligase family)